MYEPHRNPLSDNAIRRSHRRGAIGLLLFSSILMAIALIADQPAVAIAAVILSLLALLYERLTPQ
jgi:uncharacterized membrane protein YccC